MGGFTKLHATIIHSSIWQETAETRVVWVTMLAMADANGIVHASVGGLARASNVSRAACVRALECFLGPDPDSRDGTSGERIEKVPGGWFVLNHANYRDRQTREQELGAARARRWRDKQRTVTGNGVTPSDVMGETASASASASASPSASPAASGDPCTGAHSSRCTENRQQDERPSDGGSQSSGKAELMEWLTLSHYRRSGTHRTRDIVAAVERLDAAGITVDDLERLALLAKTRAKKSWGGLFAHWIDNVDEALKELGKR